MWIEFRKVPNLMMAQMWKDLLEGEGIPVRVLPEKLQGGEFSPYRIYIPKFRDHVVAEILRKL